MPSSFLVVGATGNTGGGVLHHLTEVLPQSDRFSQHRIIGLTRDTKGAKAQELAKLPRVEMIAQDWTMIDSAWLKEHQVERVFIASHNGVSQFTDESLFLNYALEAGVDYVVRISTTTTNVGPATPVFYARNHWAVETMLEQPEFRKLQWTSLQPNVFISMFTETAKDWVSTYKKDGTKKAYKLMLDGDSNAAPIDSTEVGLIAGKLLALDNVTPHASQKYCLNGPQNATGKQIISVIEKHAGTTVDDVTYRDTSFVESLRSTGYPENVLPSLAKAPLRGYNGQTSLEAMPTSPAILKIHTLQHGILDTLEAELSKA
jgi:uncharacterized protein YbjT (DUF2867 family)